MANGEWGYAETAMNAPLTSLSTCSRTENGRLMNQDLNSDTIKTIEAIVQGAAESLFYVRLILFNVSNLTCSM